MIAPASGVIAVTALSKILFRPERQCRHPFAGALRLKVPFRELAKRVGDGTGKVKRDRPISDRPAPEAIADHVHGAVGRPARYSSPGAGPALFIVEPERELELHVPA